MKRMILYKTFTALAVCASLLLAAGCKQLQDTLSTVQQEDQDKGIGYATCDTKVFYYNGAEGDSVKGENAHLVLNLNQLADAEGASVAYTLEYKMDDGVTRTASGKGEGDISNGKTKYYVDLSPAINLIDGSGNPAHGEISYAFSVTGLKNAAQGSEHNGRTFPKFSTTVKFAPLFIKDPELEFSSANIPVGTTLAIPLNGKIVAVGDVTVDEPTEGNLPDGFEKFTASVSEDGTEILLAANVPLTGAEFIADITVSGIKPVGSKETYSRTFEDFTLSSSVVETFELWSDKVTGTGVESILLEADEFAEISDSATVTVKFDWVSGDGKGTGCGVKGGTWPEIDWDNGNIATFKGTEIIQGLKSSGLAAWIPEGQVWNVTVTVSQRKETD